MRRPRGLAADTQSASHLLKVSDMMEIGKSGNLGLTTANGGPASKGDAEVKTSRKIVLVNRLFYPDESATSQLLTDLAVHLAKNDQKVVVITGRSAGATGTHLSKREQYRSVDIHRVFTVAPRGRSLLAKLSAHIFFYPGALFKLLGVVDKSDLVVVKSDPPLISVAAMVAAKVRSAKLVIWTQDLYPEVAIELHTPLVAGPLGCLLGKLRNIAIRVAEANVAIGSMMAERLIDLGIAPSRVTVIENWTDETVVRPIDPRDSLARSEWGLDASDFVVGYSGNLGQAHEVETLVGAARILRDRRDIKFAFVGGGHQHQVLRRLIEEEGLDNFIFKPHQPRDRLSDVLAAADVHWVSLRPELEGLIVPSKLYGILAAGRPVLAICDVGGEVSRIVREHSCGLVVQPGDCQLLAGAIQILADDQDYRHALGQRARIASEQVYSKSLALRAWSRLLERVARAEEGDGTKTIAAP